MFESLLGDGPGCGEVRGQEVPEQGSSQRGLEFGQQIDGLVQGRTQVG